MIKKIAIIGLGLFLTNYLIDCSEETARPTSPFFIHSIREREPGDYIEYLKRHASEINCHDEDGMTPLHLACFYRIAPVVKWLVVNGADKRAANRGGQTPLDFVLKIQNNSSGLTVINAEPTPDYERSCVMAIWNYEKQDKLAEIIDLLKK